jgi:hypothetical protein
VHAQGASRPATAFHKGGIHYPIDQEIIMFGLFKKLRFVLTYGPEIDSVLTRERISIQAGHTERERERKRHHLNLCTKHQQEGNHSHFSEHNCDHCKLLAKTAHRLGEDDGKP